MTPTHPYVISYTAGEALPFGFCWFAELGGSIHNGDPFRYFATHADAHAQAGMHKFYTNPVCLSDDYAELIAA
jgi:hypothetical protein